MWRCFNAAFYLLTPNCTETNHTDKGAHVMPSVTIYLRSEFFGGTFSIIMVRITIKFMGIVSGAQNLKWNKMTQQLKTLQI